MEEQLNTILSSPMYIAIIIGLLAIINWPTTRSILSWIFTRIGKAGWLDWADKAHNRISEAITIDNEMEVTHTMVQQIIAITHQKGMTKSEELARQLGQSLYTESPDETVG